MKFPRWFSPTHIIYVLIHIILFLTGFILVLICHDNAIGSSIGASLIAAGMAGSLIFVYVLFTQRTTERLELLTSFGFVDAFESRSVKIEGKYRSRLSRAREQIDVLGFGLSHLREDFKSEFGQWKQRAHVRILLIHPDFPAPDLSYAAQRDSEEEEDGRKGKIKEDVMKFVKETRGIVASTDHHPFEIRLYTCLPSVNIFRIDDELFWGPYLMRQLSRNTPTFVVRRGGLLFSQLAQHFENIWSNKNLSRPVPKEWCESI